MRDICFRNMESPSSRRRHRQNADFICCALFGHRVVYTTELYCFSITVYVFSLTLTDWRAADSGEADGCIRIFHMSTDNLCIN